MTPYRITFDERPGQSGPARYVGSLVKALTTPEWSVQYVDRDSSASGRPEKVESVGDRMDANGGRKRRATLKQLVPRSARIWLGFRRDMVRQSKILRSQPTDLLHIQNTGCEEMPIAAKRAKVPRVLGTFHVDSTYDLENQRSDLAHRIMEWYSNRCLPLAIAVSEATKQDWVKRTRIPSERIITIHNGIDPERFVRKQSRAEARGILGLPPEAIILGGLGRLDPAKGFAYLIEAMGQLRADFPQVYAAIAGRGPLQKELESQAADLGVSDRVIFLGFQDDVNLVLDACDVFVLSSLCEALPFALLEAIAHELPAVGTSVGGVPEVIVPGETGFLSPPRNGVSLAGAIRPLIESSELRQRFGRAGRARVIKHFHETDMVRKTLDVYRRMLSAKPTIAGVQR